MSELKTVEVPLDRPVIATICGDSGMGKTSLAAAFPDPIFIRAEDGLQALPADKRPAAFPVVTDHKKAQDSTAKLWRQINALLKEDHGYKTLVIDSVTALERLFVAEVIERDGKVSSINQAFGGYGAGWGAVAASHQRLRKACGLLNARKNMHVVFIAHADTETIKTPDTEDYMRWTLRLNPKHSIAPYVDDVDVVGFLRLETYTTGQEGERKKAISTGQRELVTYATAANVSKNRYGITRALPVAEGTNPLASIVPSLGGAPTYMYFEYDPTEEDREPEPGDPSFDQGEYDDEPEADDQEEV